MPHPPVPRANSMPSRLRMPVHDHQGILQGRFDGMFRMNDATDPNRQSPLERPEVVLSCADLDAAIAFYTGVAGFRLDMIMPADSPDTAVVSRGNLVLRLETQADPSAEAPRTRIRVPANGESGSLNGPDGSVIEFAGRPSTELLVPESAEWIISRAEDGTAWVRGRADMEYRDLIPGRRQQSMIASHIRVTRAGPVADYVHYHHAAFQMIFCRRGWARLVYENQGPPFVMNAGDCVLQPPAIRHQVLEASAGFEVIELCSPARHETWRDHSLSLPMSRTDPTIEYCGQRFVHHVALGADWQEATHGKARIRYTGISGATHGLASVRTLRIEHSLTASSGRFLFLFVLDGSCDLHVAGAGNARLQVDDASLLPSHVEYELTTEGPCELLEVSLPANPHP